MKNILYRWALENKKETEDIQSLSLPVLRRLLKEMSIEELENGYYNNYDGVKKKMYSMNAITLLDMCTLIIS